MRPVKRSEKFDRHGKPVEYDPYGSAKSELVDEVGDFCSFCGKQVNRSALAVEHILAKSYQDSSGNKPYEQYQYHWNNFLLACTNCNSVKGKKDVNSLNPYLPHKHNLLCYIEFAYGGVLKIKPSLSVNNEKATKAFIDLVGLDRCPGHPKYSQKDDRWEYRMTTYDIAEDQLIKYNEKRTDIDNIATIATSRGFFSVWFTVFSAHKDVKQALINAFKGTNASKFDISLCPID